MASSDLAGPFAESRESWDTTSRNDGGPVWTELISGAPSRTMTGSSHNLLNVVLDLIFDALPDLVGAHGRILH